jgi:hypothetical protein
LGHGFWTALTAKGASNRSLFLALCHCGSSFRFNSKLHPRAWVEAYLVTIFVLQRVLDADLSIPIIGAFYCNLYFFRVFGCGDSIIVSTIPGKVVLGVAWPYFNNLISIQQPRLGNKAHSVDQQLRHRRPD